MKQVFLVTACVMLWFTSPALADSWTISDDYYGGGAGNDWEYNNKLWYIQEDGDVISDKDEIDDFDIDSMTVTISDTGVVQVIIQTDYENDDSVSYGDLWVSTDGWDPYGSGSTFYDDDTYENGEDWEFVFDSSTGYIYLVDESNILISDDEDDMDGIAAHWYRHDQETTYDPDSNETAIGTFTFDTTSDDLYIIYSFNLSDLGFDYEDELYLGFHWTMTCANDVIEGEIYKAAIPEPGTMLLMGLGLVGIGAIGRRKQQQDQGAIQEKKG